MKVSFIGQPVPAYGGLFADWLIRQLNDPAIRELRVAVAWVKRSGLLRLSKELEAFKARGGTTSFIVGIGEGGATSQGLQLALEWFDEVFIFHDPRSHTYHPKVYLAFGMETAELAVGSNNLTRGGLFSNYEAGLCCQLDLHMTEDHALFKQVREWFELLQADTGACKLLTPELLGILINDSRYQIGDEDHPRRDIVTGEDDTDGVTTDSPAASVFSVPTIPRAPIPARATRRVNPQPQNPQLTPSAARSLIGILQWRKRLSRADAQQPQSTNTNPTGNLKLAKAENAIDHKVYFREEMFGHLAWTRVQSKSGSMEATSAIFDIIIDGVEYGLQELKIDHDLNRVAKQNNVPTWLHWGSYLRTILRSTDYTDAWVIIERRTDGTFRLEIDRDNTAANS